MLPTVTPVTLTLCADPVYVSCVLSRVTVAPVMDFGLISAVTHFGSLSL